MSEIRYPPSPVFKSAQVLMIIRVYALYSRSRPILILLVVLMLIAIVIAAVRVTLPFSDRLMAFRRTVGCIVVSTHYYGCGLQLGQHVTVPAQSIFVV